MDFDLVGSARVAGGRAISLVGVVTGGLLSVQSEVDGRHQVKVILFTDDDSVCGELDKSGSEEKEVQNTASRRSGV